MTIKAHRVSYYLHTIIKRTVSLDVDMLIILIGDREYFISIIAVLACSVYLKLNSEESLGITIKDRLRLIPIVMDASVTIYLFVITFRTVVIAVQVVGVILMKKGVTTRAAGIVIFVTVTAESSILVTIAIVSPDSFTASVTGSRVMFKAVSADYLSVDFLIVVVFSYERTAV
jgi:hypothetical protein